LRHRHQQAQEAHREGRQPHAEHALDDAGGEEDRADEHEVGDVGVEHGAQCPVAVRGAPSIFA
jgi:hypothetical protein